MNPLRIFLLAALMLVILTGEVDAKEPEWSFHPNGNGQMRSVSISADGEYIVASTEEMDYNGNQGGILFFKKNNSTPIWTFSTGSGKYASSVSISADGEYIIANSNHNRLYLFGKDSDTPLWFFNTTDSETRFRAADISSDGEYIVASSSNSDENFQNVYLFSKDNNTPLWSYNTVDESVRSVSISANGDYITAADSSGNIYLFDKDSSTPLWSYYTSADYVASVDISADGEYIVAGSGPEDGKVYLFDKDSSTPLWSYYTSAACVASVAISADGEYITAGSGPEDTNIYLFDKDSSTPLWTYDIDGKLKDDHGLAISADGESIAVSSYYNSPKIYAFEKSSSAPLWTYEGGSTFSVSISADGNYIAAGTTANEVYFFNNNFLPIATIDSIIPSPARFDAEVSLSGSGSDSDGTILAYEWKSSIDGFLSDEEDFSTSLSAGNHTIFFRVQDNDGEWSDYSRVTLVVNSNNRPLAVIDSIYPSPVEKGTAVYFNGTGLDSDGTIVVHLWESSIDGFLSNDEDFATADLSIGDHIIYFQVKDNNEDWSSDSQWELWIYTVPVAIAGQNATGTPGVPLQFSGAGIDEDGTIAKYEWDFDGDGVFEWSSTENGMNTYIYNNEGIYTATLRVTDNNGFTDTDTVEITISEKKIQIDDEDNVTVTDAGEDEEGIPSLSFIPALISIGLMAILRRKN